MSQIDENDIQWLQNGEKAEAVVLNRPVRSLLTSINSELQSNDTNISNIQDDILAIFALLESDDVDLDDLQKIIDFIKLNRTDINTITDRLNSKIETPTILNSGNNLDWKTVFNASSFSSTYPVDSIQEAEYSIYTDKGTLVRTIVKDSDFYSVQFSLTDMLENTKYQVRVRYRGLFNWSEQSEPFTFTSAMHFEKIYGVALLETGGNGGTLVHVDIEGNVIDLRTADFDVHPVWGGMEDQVIDGQSMVRVPKFYSKYEKKVVTGPGAPAGVVPVWYISDQPAQGFETYPAFFDAGEEVDQFWYGKYQAYVTGGKMGSVPGVLPTVNTSLDQFKSLAEARNTGGVDGFMVLSWYQLSAIQWLYLVENATFDSQAKTGQGRVSASDAAGVDAPDVAQATYRGIVGLWGNVQQWIDGFIWNPSTGIKVWDRLGNKTWVETNKFYTLDFDTHQYPITHMIESDASFNLTDGFVGEIGTTSIAQGTVSDSNYFGPAVRDSVPRVGGWWSAGSHAGLWYFIVDNTSTFSNIVIVSRLARL